MSEPLIELSGTAILWLKAGHVIGMIAWMAGMFYLPRLFVYHVEATPGSVQSETFKVMERRLMKAIINPAMIATLIFGVLLLLAQPELMRQGWLHAKLTAVFFLFALHGMMSMGFRLNVEAEWQEKIPLKEGIEPPSLPSSNSPLVLPTTPSIVAEEPRVQKPQWLAGRRTGWLERNR